MTDRLGKICAGLVLLLGMTAPGPCRAGDAAVGVLLDGREEHAFHGVTSVENPLPVNERTLFLCGSTTKTFTATAIVRLAGQGLVDLDAPVRTYVPELRVEHEEAAAAVTVERRSSESSSGRRSSRASSSRRLSILCRL